MHISYDVWEKEETGSMADNTDFMDIQMTNITDMLQQSIFVVPTPVSLDCVSDVLAADCSDLYNLDSGKVKLVVSRSTDCINEIIPSENSNSNILVSSNSVTSNVILNHETGLFEAVNDDVDNTENDDNEINNELLSISNRRKLNQRLRLLGKEYKGLKKIDGAITLVKKSHRKLREAPCNHGYIKVSDRSFLCGSVNEQARKDIFDYFWGLSSWEAKKAYLVALVDVRNVKTRRRTSDGSSFRRKLGIDCYLPKLDGIKVRVCRKFFIATLDITKNTFTEWTGTKKKDEENERESLTERNTKQILKPIKSDSVNKWLDLLPKVSSHYCRSTSSRVYVEESLKSKSEMHKIYTSWCVENSLNPVKRKKFCEILESKKISIFKPRKDQCDTCVAYKEENLKEEDYQIHITKKDEAREAKKVAISTCSDQHSVVTIDLQSTQLCPKLLVSSQYYKQKLQLHDFTIFKNNTKDVFLYVWHVGDGGVSANEFVSCIHFIEGEIHRGYKKITLISDGCTYQNKNKILSSALADISKFRSIEIEQIILEKGHTMMEVDSVHSTLEKLFTPPLYSPGDYINRMRKARPTQPYTIYHLEYSFFKNYEAVPSNYNSIRPGKKAGDPTVTDIRALLYKNGDTMYKLRHTENWTLLPQRRKSDLYESPKALYTEPRKI